MSDNRLAGADFVRAFACLMVVGHHIAQRLSPQTVTHNWADVLAVSRAIETEFQPVKMNLLTLGNSVPHLHTHVVPRYGDDPAPGGPIAWADMFNEEPDDPRVEAERAARLRARLTPPG